MNKNTIATILVIMVTIGIGVLIAFSGGTPEVSTDTSTGDVIRETAYHKGSPGASVEIVEFSDFQCPACKANSSILREVADFYGNKVALYYRHFPLTQHQFSDEAAWAAEAAGKQGKFWEMHDKIFENQDSLSIDIFGGLATELGLDIEQFKTDQRSREIKDIVAGDLKDGKTLKVNSTPTFFLNGEKVEAGNTLAQWQVLIEEKLGQANGE